VLRQTADALGAREQFPQLASVVFPLGLTFGDKAAAVVLVACLGAVVVAAFRSRN